MRVAKADLVPTDYNLREDYRSFAELEAACEALSAELNGRPHSVTRRGPAELLEIERPHLHAIPDALFTAAFGESRRAGWSATVSFRGARYSLPERLCDTQVWVRTAGGEVIITSGEGSVLEKWPAISSSAPARPRSATALHPPPVGRLPFPPTQGGEPGGAAVPGPR